MKKRYLGLVLASLFSMSLVSCGQATSQSEISTCDPMFDDCDTQVIENVELKRDNNPNYTYEDVSNANGSVSYEIFVRTFYDSNNDGIGDFNGITSKLDYLKTLGVSNLWLMPIHPSPSYHGYDVSNYVDVHPDYGTMQDFENLINKAKEKGISIMIDMVLNHSSRNHPWFEQSYNDFKSNNNSSTSKKDYYNWTNQGKNGYSKYKDLYYESRFDSSMPDLNTKSEKLRNEIDQILKFWINKGVKGFRLDAVKFFELDDAGYNIRFLTFLKETSQKYANDISFVGECWDNKSTVLNYYKSKCDSFFNFSYSLAGDGFPSIATMVNKASSADGFGSSIESYENELKINNSRGYSSYFLTNHDQDRASNALQGNTAYMAASLYLMMPGTPYIYYGEEIELKGLRNISPDDRSDARRRLPMVWSSQSKTGECKFPESNRQDLANNNQVSMGVEDKLNENYSLLNHYRKVINVRNKYPFIKNARFQNLTSYVKCDSKHVLVYRLYDTHHEIIVAHNFEDYNVKLNAKLDGYHISDSISFNRWIPTLGGNKLAIGANSSVVLTK